MISLNLLGQCFPKSYVGGRDHKSLQGQGCSSDMIHRIALLQGQQVNFNLQVALVPGEGDVGKPLEASTGLPNAPIN